MDITVVIAFLLSLVYFAESKYTLELASMVFRHGDRSPVGTFPTDMYTESDWPQGYGQLSIVGMQQEEMLGGLLRSRYVTDTYPNFLNSSYRRVQVTVRSTDVDRTLMSGASLLSALFPPNESERFNESLAWQPIPIHTVPVKDDHLLRGYGNCPAYSKLREADKSMQEYQQMETENKEFFDVMANYTGLEVVNLTNIWSVEDTVFVENVTTGKMEPSWATASVLAKLRNLSDYTLSLMFNSKAKNRLSAGVWLGKVLGDMKNKANGPNTLSKLFLYSAHDTTVACKLSALGLFDGKQPPYATMFVVELLSDTNGQYYVRFVLRKGPDSTEFTVLEQPGCANTKLCALAEFEQLVKPLIPTDIEQECALPSPTVPPSSTTPLTPTTPPSSGSNQGNFSFELAFGLVTAVLVIIIVVLIGALVIVYLRGRKYAYNSRSFQRFESDA